MFVYNHKKLFFLNIKFLHLGSKFKNKYILKKLLEIALLFGVKNDFFRKWCLEKSITNIVKIIKWIFLRKNRFLLKKNPKQTYP
jgi:hypothetical protein